MFAPGVVLKSRVASRVDRVLPVATSPCPRLRARILPGAGFGACPGLCLLIALAVAILPKPSRSAEAAAPVSGGQVDFAKDVFPILKERCFDCHGPEKQKAELRLDGRETAMRGAKSGPVILPGKGAQSPLYLRVSTASVDDVMPPKGERLTPAQTARILAWIDGGASWPDGVGVAPGQGQVKRHWAYVAPAHTTPPAVQRKNWVRNPIDNFVLARLEKEGLKPSAEASKETLIRRLSLDLTGLPPSLEEVDQFLADRSPEAYERLVDRLLASAHYGERWARPWLDMARYADTNGYEADNRRSNWPWRDWVIQALNRDLPFDRFTVEQLAGDLLPNPTVDQLIATGFHRNTMVNTEGGTDEEEFRTAAIIDRVNTTFEVWMGTTFNCCQCHNHKYDPFTQKEYYQVFAIFNQTKDLGRSNDPVLELPNAAQAAKRMDLRYRIGGMEKILATQTPELDQRQLEWENKRQPIRERVAAGWSVPAVRPLTPARGGSLSVQADSSVLASGDVTDTNIYTIEATVTNLTATAVKLEVLADPSLPQQASGRSETGNWVLTEFELESRPLEGAPLAVTNVDFSPWSMVGPFAGKSMDDAFNTAFAPENKVDLTASYEDGKLKWLPRPEFADGQAHELTGENAATYLYRTIQATTAGPLLVSLGSDDGVQVWLNGERLLSKNVSRGVAPDQDFVRLDLVQGENRLLLKVVNGGGGYGFYFAIAKDQTGVVRVPLVKAYSDTDDGKSDPQAAIDNEIKTGWTSGNLDQTNRMNREAVFVSRSAFTYPGGTRLTFRLKQESQGYKRHLIGRFRLSLSDAPRAAHEDWGGLPPKTRAILAAAKGDRSEKQRDDLAAYYRGIDPALNPVREQVAQLKKEEPSDVPSTLVLKQVEKPRTSYVFKRGSFLNKGDEVQPGVPAILPPISASFASGSASNAVPDRLDFARWLGDPRNPLVGRVTVNRIWAAYFGRGFVETSEDFGLQGEPPTHQDLLDWLATEFVSDGWSLKRLHRLIVTSATYRQSSAGDPALFHRDPYNRLLARGPRFRLEAEMLRDNALAVSGLLNREVGGPSVFPFQPEGVWRNPYSSDQWATQTNGNQFRRGLYTFWRRTSPYASFQILDAPSREVCTERRPKTDTPLQALVTLNDPAFLAPAAALARKVASRPGGSLEDRVTFAFRACTSRMPTRDEVRRLAGLFNETVAGFRADPTQAEALSKKYLNEPPPADVDPKELAAWTVVANVLLNLDEVLTKG